MSFKYLLKESFIKTWNKISGGGYKKKFYETLAHPEPVEEVPSYFYKRFTVQKVIFDGQPYFTIKSKKRTSDCAILYMAGGGGLAGPTENHFKTLARLADTSGATICLAIYPPAPEHNVRFALRWLQKVYANLLKDFKSHKIILAGDGTGANLALSLCSRLANKPGRIVAISPAAGLGLKDCREPMEKAEPGDLFLSMESLDLISENWGGNVPPESPDLQPSAIDFTGFPPVQIFYGTKEIFYPMMGTLTAKIESTDTALEIHYKNMCHSWVLMQDIPEGRAAVKQIAAFVDKMLVS